MNETAGAVAPTDQGQTQTELKQFTLDEAGRAAINAERRAQNPRRADGYLAVQLVGRAGWTPEQAAEFLGLKAPSVLAWRNSYARSGLEGLQQMPDPMPLTHA